MNEKGSRNSMKCKVGVISGDGIGPEIVREAKKYWIKLAEHTDMSLYIQTF